MPIYLQHWCKNSHESENPFLIPHSFYFLSRFWNWTPEEQPLYFLAKVRFFFLSINNCVSDCSRSPEKVQDLLFYMPEIFQKSFSTETDLHI